jgi:hypothetical protein
MWEPRRLTYLWASTACYRDSFTFIFTSAFAWRDWGNPRNIPSRVAVLQTQIWPQKGVNKKRGCHQPGHSFRIIVWLLEKQCTDMYSSHGCVDGKSWAANTGWSFVYGFRTRVSIAHKNKRNGLCAIWICFNLFRTEDIYIYIFVAMITSLQFLRRHRFFFPMSK